MSQISMPIRIVLVAAVVLLAAWFTVLQPKEIPIPPSPTAPGAASNAVSSKAGDFAAKAKAGAATAEKDAAGAANATLEDDGVAAPPTAASPPATGTSATGTAAATGATTRAQQAPTAPALDPKLLAKLPANVRGALEDRKVLVLGVLNTQGKPWAPMADDDRSVRNALERVNRYGGGVVVRTARFSKLASYDGVLSALQIRQSPTVVIVDRNRRAVALTGYVDRLSINQAIADARRNSTETLIKDSYLAKINVRCGHYGMRYERWSLPTGRNSEGAAIRRLFALAAKDRRSIARIAAPAKWRGLKAQMLRAQDLSVANGRRAVAAASRGKYAAAFAALTADLATFKALDRRFNAVGLTACASNRTQ